MKRNRDERGQVGGAEAVVFGVLVFVFGSLGIVSAWVTVDTRLAVSSAAREATRTYVESSGGPEGSRLGEEAGRNAFAAHGHDRASLALRIEAPDGFRRCAAVRVTATTRLHLPGIPVISAVARRATIEERRTEVVDPHRSGLKRASGNPCS